VDGASLHEDPRARAAVLACVPEDGERRGGGRALEIRVGEDDVRRLAAELERDALDRLRRDLADPTPDGGRAREGDLRDVGVRDEPLADHAPWPGDDVEHALR